jgi:hypothetical protein
MPMRFPSPNLYSTRRHAPEVQHFDEGLKAKYYEAVDLLEKDPSIAKVVSKRFDIERFLLVPFAPRKFLGLGFLVNPMCEIRELYFFCAKPIFGDSKTNLEKLNARARVEIHSAFANYRMLYPAE